MIDKLNILLIDDDSITNFLHENLIRQNSKYTIGEIEMCHNGQEALSYLTDLNNRSNSSKSIPNLVFLDINMPIMDGHQFMAHYSKLPTAFIKNIVLTVLTSSLSEKDKVMERQYEEINYYLNKPLEMDDFHQVAHSIKGQ